MNELEEIWAAMLADAIRDAKISGRHSVADYLALKASNDEIRRTGIEWLLNSMIELAGKSNRRAANITIERHDPHQFNFDRATMTGSLLRLNHGVRTLNLEAGWTRTPADGFMRSGALAAARIIHFGIKEKNADLILLRETAAPEWFAVAIGGGRKSFVSKDMQSHFDIFLGE